MLSYIIEFTFKPLHRHKIQSQGLSFPSISIFPCDARKRKINLMHHPLKRSRVLKCWNWNGTLSTVCINSDYGDEFTASSVIYSIFQLLCMVFVNWAYWALLSEIVHIFCFVKKIYDKQIYSIQGIISKQTSYSAKQKFINQVLSKKESYRKNLSC